MKLYRYIAASTPAPGRRPLPPAAGRRPPPETPPEPRGKVGRHGQTCRYGRPGPARPGPCWSNFAGKLVKRPCPVKRLAPHAHATCTHTNTHTWRIRAHFIMFYVLYLYNTILYYINYYIVLCYSYIWALTRRVPPRLPVPLRPAKAKISERSKKPIIYVYVIII